MNDIVAVAESLGKKSVAVIRDRCAAVRHRRSNCRRCVRICPVGAIEVGGNEITLDARVCIGCGACAGACPTEALVAIDPTDADLNEASKMALKANGGDAVIACARISSKHTADPSKYAEVPCLPRVDETFLLTLAARGANSILLVDGNCSTCKYHHCSSITDDIVERANGLLSSHGSKVEVKRATGFPEDMLIEDAGGLFGATRRGFFSDAVGTAKEAAVTAAKVTVAQEFGYDIDEALIGERLRVGENGTLPQIGASRHMAAIDALDAIGAPKVEDIESRLFGSISIDAKKCNSCGMCATFCPTGALKRDVPEKPGDMLRYFEFSACDCVQCGLCVDVCMKRAVKLSTNVKADELYDFEPTVFKLR